MRSSSFPLLCENRPVATALSKTPVLGKPSTPAHHLTRRWSTSPASPAPGHPPQALQQSVWWCHRHTATVRGRSFHPTRDAMQAVVLTPSPLLPQHAASESLTGGMPPRTEPPSKVAHQSTFPNFERDNPILARDRGGRQPVSLLPKKAIRSQQTRCSSIHRLPLDGPKCSGMVVTGRKRFQAKTFQPPCRDLPDKGRRLPSPSRDVSMQPIGVPLRPQ